MDVQGLLVFLRLIDFSWDKYWGEADIFFFYDKEIKRRFFDSMQKVGLVFN